jgi:acetyl-CoA carboxylase beta subunit
MSDDNRRHAANEREYFVRQNIESVERKRAQIRAEMAAAERKSHFMKCPNCGADLHMEEFHGVQIERCLECNGIWVNAGEIDRLVAHEETGMIGRVLKDVIATFTPHHPASS